jgi:uncharacterized protein YndB with AHSA1/START domain
MPGAPEIRVVRLVRGDPGDVFEFLTDLENHWLLADRFIEVVELDGPDRPSRGGRVRMRGPLGLRRTAVTRVLEIEPPTRIAGTAAIGARTLACVTWTLIPVNGSGTRVTLTATMARASVLDRTLLVAGGAPWMRRRLETILTRLDGALSSNGAAPRRG